MTSHISSNTVLMLLVKHELSPQLHGYALAGGGIYTKHTGQKIISYKLILLFKG